MHKKDIDEVALQDIFNRKKFFHSLIHKSQVDSLSRSDIHMAKSTYKELKSVPKKRLSKEHQKTLNKISKYIEEAISRVDL